MPCNVSIFHHQVSAGHQTSVTTSASSGAPLVLSLSQIQSSGGLLILNSGNQSHTAHIPTSHTGQHQNNSGPQVIDE